MKTNLPNLYTNTNRTLSYKNNEEKILNRILFVVNDIFLTSQSNFLSCVCVIMRPHILALCCGRVLKQVLHTATYDHTYIHTLNTQHTTQISITAIICCPSHCGSIFKHPTASKYTHSNTDRHGYPLWLSNYIFQNG